MRELKRDLKMGTSTKRIYGLDILRAIAILSVLIGHSTIFLPPKPAQLSLYFSWDGVSIFFVLSGFLIGGVLLKVLDSELVSPESLFQFWFKRWMRTLPSYFLILFVVTTETVLFHRGELPSIAPYIFFLQNFNKPHPFFFPEAWSLSVEECFYIVVPLMLFILIGCFNASIKRAMLIVSTVILLLCTIVRIVRFSHLPLYSIIDVWDIFFRKQVITRLDSIMFGLIGAYLYHFHQADWIRYAKPLSFFGVLGFVTHHALAVSGFLGFGFYTCVLYFPVNALFVLMTLPALTQTSYGRGIFYRGIRSVSVMSYSIYLLNYSIVRDLIVMKFQWGFLSPDLQKIVQYVSFWVITFIASYLLYNFFERPILRARDRIFFFGRKQPAPAFSQSILYVEERQVRRIGEKEPFLLAVQDACDNGWNENK